MRQWSISSLHGKLILAATILASGFVFLFGSAITVALPTIQADFNASLSGIQWIVNAFTLVLGAFILISGALSDRYGRKRIFILGIVIFSFGLLFSGFAQTLSWLVAFQVVAGIGAAMLVPASLAVVRTCFYERELGRAIGMWAGLATGLAAFGPLLGGVLVDAWGWRAIFFSLVPLALLVLLVVVRYIPKIEKKETGTLDIGGVGAVAIALFGILFALIQGPEIGWAHPLILISIVVGVCSFIAFIFIERRAANPIVPFAIFRSSSVSGANIVTLLLYFVFGGTFFFVTLNLQQIQGISPTLSGVALLPPAILMALFSGLAGRLTDRFGARLPMIFGPLLVAASTMLLAFTDANTDYYFYFLPTLILLGIGMTLVVPALTKSALAAADKYSGVASGINNAISRTAWLLAVAILGAVSIFSFSSYLERELPISNLPAPIQNEILEKQTQFGGIEITTAQNSQAREEGERLVKSAFVHSFRIIFFINTALALLASIAAFIFIKSPPVALRRRKE